jgi:hypothetical protein
MVGSTEDNLVTEYRIRRTGEYQAHIFPQARAGKALQQARQIFVRLIITNVEDVRIPWCMPSPSRTKGRSYAIPNDDDVLVWHPCPGENFMLGIPGYGEHPIRSMYGWTHH